MTLMKPYKSGSSSPIHSLLRFFVGIIFFAFITMNAKILGSKTPIGQNITKNDVFQMQAQTKEKVQINLA